MPEINCEIKFDVTVDAGISGVPVQTRAYNYHREALKYDVAKAERERLLIMARIYDLAEDKFYEAIEVAQVQLEVMKDQRAKINNDLKRVTEALDAKHKIE